MNSTNSWRKPGWLFVAAVTVGAMLASVGPLKDVDVFWHTRLGSEILSGMSIFEVGDNWSYLSSSDNWVSTQWLTELLFSWLNTVFGWNGLIGFRVVTIGLALVVVALTVLNGRRTWSGLVAFSVCAYSLVIFSQERPQQISFVLLPLVGYWWLRAVRDGRVPKWWWMLPLAALWANMHGLWILLPTALGLALAGRFIDRGWRARRDPAVKALLLSTLAAIAGGCLTPSGPLNLLSPLRLAGSTGQIVEWNPTSILSPATWGFAVATGLLIVAWARGTTRAGRSEMLFALFFILLGTAAARNVTPALLMLAPLLGWRLEVAFRGPMRSPAPAGLLVVAGPATAVVAALGVALAGFATTAAVAVPPDSRPVGLVAQITEMPGVTRVLNDYNVGGLVLWFSGPGSASGNHGVQVGIDGRSDRYGGAYIDKYVDMQNGMAGWQQSFEALSPQVVLIAARKPLSELLQSKGWTVIGTEAQYVLLGPGVSSTVSPPRDGSASAKTAVGRWSHE